MLDIERHVMSRLTFDEGTDTEQVWSPDGRELIFGSERAGKPTSLYRKPADGSGEEQLAAQSDFAMWPTTWSPEGRVGFSANRKTFDVGVVTLGDKPEYQWPAASPFVETDPAFSPDSRWMAYASNESGAQQIYVRPYPDRHGPVANLGRRRRDFRGGRVTVASCSSATTPASWQPPSKSAATACARANTRQVIAGTFRGGAQGLTIAGNAFADYDVTADGKRFVMFPKGDEGVAAEAGLVTLVSGWFDEVTPHRQALTAAALLLLRDLEHAQLPLTSFDTISSGLPFGLSSAGSTRAASGPRSPAATVLPAAPNCGC